MMKGMDENMSCASGDQASVSSTNNGSHPPKRKRNQPGNPDPDAEVIALSPKSLLATNRFICEICKKGFQRDQNLQLHRRGHNLPWKLKQRSSKEVRKKVYVCPESSCVHHHPSRALGDLTGIKKHFFRKHGEKKWKCHKCSKKYAVQSDWKAHSKTCGTREYRCDCGTLFSRRDSFITHRAFCDALAEESSRSNKAHNSSSSPSSLLLHQQMNQLQQIEAAHFNEIPFPIKKEEPFNHPWLVGPPPNVDLTSSFFGDFQQSHDPNPNPSTVGSTPPPPFSLVQEGSHGSPAGVFIRPQDHVSANLPSREELVMNYGNLHNNKGGGGISNDSPGMVMIHDVMMNNDGFEEEEEEMGFGIVKRERDFLGLRHTDILTIAGFTFDHHNHY